MEGIPVDGYDHVNYLLIIRESIVKHINKHSKVDDVYSLCYLELGSLKSVNFKADMVHLKF